MKITQIELIHLDVPFTFHTHQHMQYWLPHWRISQLCKITLESGVVGWGETLPNYTWAKVPAEIADQVVGRNAADLLWHDELGAGVQMALFDAVGKTLGVPVYRLLAHKKVRDWAPISWWAMDMPPADWAEQCAEAVRQGYLSAKLKARTWYDLHAALQAIFAVVPAQFILDLDFNATLDNAANAVKFLSTLEPFKQVAMFESPIPQEDVAGNRQIRRRINRPVAMHYGSPPIMTTLHEDVADGFVLCAGAAKLLRQAHICAEANKPFWLQLVGTGITTSWMAHFGAVLEQAKWPAITCMNIWEEQLIQPTIELRSGFLRVPEAPGLGVEIDLAAVERYRVDYAWINPPRHVYRYSRANGEVTYYGCGKQELHRIYPDDAQPVCEAGSTLTVVADDGSIEFAHLHAAVQNGQTLRRLEPTSAAIIQGDASLPVTKSALVAQIAEAWTELIGFVGELSDAQFTVQDGSGWTVKDHLAHLTPWARGTAALLRHQPHWPSMGLDEATRHNYDVDAINDLLHQRSVQQSLRLVILDLADAHQQVLAALNLLSDADLRRPYTYYQPGEFRDSDSPVVNWIVGNTSEHYREHLGWLRELVRRGAQQELLH